MSFDSAACVISSLTLEPNGTNVASMGSVNFHLLILARRDKRRKRRATWGLVGWDSTLLLLSLTRGPDGDEWQPPFLHFFFFFPSLMSAPRGEVLKCRPETGGSYMMSLITAPHKFKGRKLL